jgi:hypothetical protein
MYNIWLLRILNLINNKKYIRIPTAYWKHIIITWVHDVYLIIIGIILLLLLISSTILYLQLNNLVLLVFYFLLSANNWIFIFLF